MKRKINLIVLHCTATVEGRRFDVDDIGRMHSRPPFNFAGIGYHMLFGIDGEDWEGRPFERVGAHAKGHNEHSLGLCYVGGIGLNGKPKDTRTAAQLVAMERRAHEFAAMFPNAQWRGHRDLSPDVNHDGKITPNEWLKSCPCFDVAEWCRSIGIDPR